MMELKISEVVKGAWVGMPLNKSGWGMVKAEKNGIVVSLGQDGVFVSEDDLLYMRYARVPCTPNDSDREQ